uniref:GTP pyrophosphokinase n=1 Tax=Acetatifactor sp. TaxID=1872090 RepID=UPI004055B3F9
MDITKEKFLETYKITPEQFENAQFSWADLVEIAEDYEERCRTKYDAIRNKFIEEFFLNKEEKTGLQSYRSRCKNPEHVIEKIIRKRNENYTKYKDISKDNYWMFLTDLIGVRGLLLYREDWVKFHQYIIGEIANDPDKYIKENSISDYVSDDSVFMAEAPKVHIRSGDFYEIYTNWIPSEYILDKKHYRSIHYIVNYKGVYIEIQIRTLFEEGWGEIDHDILYPRQKDNPMLIEFSELLNRLSGMGDEMGSFYHRLQNVPEADFPKKEQIVTKPKNGQLVYTNHGDYGDIQNVITFQDAINRVVNE